MKSTTIMAAAAAAAIFSCLLVLCAQGELLKNLVESVSAPCQSTSSGSTVTDAAGPSPSSTALRHTPPSSVPTVTSMSETTANVQIITPTSDGTSAKVQIITPTSDGTSAKVQIISQPAGRSSKCLCSNKFVKLNEGYRPKRNWLQVHESSVFCPQVEIILTIPGQTKKCLDPASRQGRRVLLQHRLMKRAAASSTEASSQTPTWSPASVNTTSRL